MRKKTMNKLALGLALSMTVTGLAACSDNPETTAATTTKESTEKTTETTAEKTTESTTPEASTAESKTESTTEATIEESVVKNKYGLTLENLPVLDGATANEPYYEGVVQRMLDIDQETAKKNVLCSTTGGAFTNLINGDADMIFVSYPSKDQVQEAKDNNVEFEYHQILTGAFVFFVNKDNPVDSLTIEQLKGIYRGDITNWKEVGGNDEEIVAYQREEGSGSQNGLYRYLLPKEEVMQAPEQYYFSDMEGIVRAFGNAEYNNSNNAIGYSYYYYVVNMETNDELKMITLEGVEPSDETIGNGTYPFCNPTLAVVRKGTDPESKVYDIIDWIMSDEGAELAKELGYVANRSGGNMEE